MRRLMHTLARLAAACLAPSPLGRSTPQTWTAPR
ncbi:hypothetical protein GA0070617_1293 [Micromonospora yangpuensis]|uniref:Uncharacterized protein n=1 Tax=Micromonospora yangpuensis TaxID=683228 RepID=A0A1C6U715_9ACTN|nr:hypothetical protein GA0070617_1293 [Micromonospora yangpuensis]